MSTLKPVGQSVSQDNGEKSLRGKSLNGGDQKDSAAHLQTSESANSDQQVHTDGEEDTLYDDGLELEDDSRPLKGINGKDDT